MFKNYFISCILVCVTLTNLPAQDNLPGKLEWFEQFFKGRHSSEPGTEILRLEQKIAEAKEAHDLKQEASLRKELGLVQLSRIPDYEKAIDQFIISLQIEDSLNLKTDMIITYIAMAKVFEEVGDYYKTAESLENAMEYSREFNDIDVLAYLANKLGNIDVQLDKKTEAREYYDLVIKNSDKLTSRKAEGDAYYNLGELNITESKFETALGNHKQALDIRRSMNDKVSEAQSLNEIGELYKLMKNPDKALANHIVALEIRRKINDLRGVAESYNNIGALYYQQKNISRAAANLQLGLEVAKTLQSAELQARSNEYLSFCYRDAGDFKKALEHKEEFIHLTDFLRREKTENEILERQNRFNLEKKEQEINKLEMNRRQQEVVIAGEKKIRHILLALVGFGIIIILLIFYLYLIKRRSNQKLEAANARVHEQNSQLQKLNATKDKFFSIISHDLKGPLNSFTAFSGMLINHTDSLTREEIQQLAMEIDKNLKNLLVLLENLLEWSRSQTGSIEFKAEPADLHPLLIQNRDLLKTQAANKKIQIIYQNTVELPVTIHKHSINTVIRNLVSNAIKFTPEGGTITLGVAKAAGNLTVLVKDTGVGMSEEVLKKLFRIDTKYSTHGTSNEKGTGLGLILCKDFVEKNGGTIHVESVPGQGSTFSFSLPLAPYSPGVTAIAKETAHA